ncbi:hypothetical protein BO78DRAFT_388704 [Aspergillus sclerotiicarbonarius CBS 121057]|uniref:Histone chaperone domain-containing protein n=1 Tax=Aspergillus sclerotiicarbonarius (strain CBS 121057 / IBT 28362) TaxID=1448318 RepID=A0A319E817_ASPSB|nr:hypothetical protein BO78DRAFT_388704 [Aspergillus sclerotiicarbonarius CBS 121057]
MGDNNQATTGYTPGSNAPDAAAWGKGKGKATDPAREMRMDDDESEESEGEEMLDEGTILHPTVLPLDSVLSHTSSNHTNLVPRVADEDEDNDSLEPISADNIISGGRRTRGKNIDFQQAAEKLKADEMDDDDDEDDDYVGAADEDDDNKMRD